MAKSFKIAVTRRVRDFIKNRLGVTLPLGLLKFSGLDRMKLEVPCRISSAIELMQRLEVGAFSFCDASESSSPIKIREVSIGRYSSIAMGCAIGLMPHPTTWLSTSPTIYESGANEYARRYLLGIMEYGAFRPAKTLTRIGNDVWLGQDVKVLKGVEIGDGAIVGAGAVVTKDVPPYAVVGGVPAKIIRYRFDEATIKRLLAVKWWNYDLSSFGSIDFSNIHKALDAIETATREGRARPYAKRTVQVADLYPYSRRCLFHCSCRDGWLCVKAFGLWILHCKIGKRRG